MLVATVAMVAFESRFGAEDALAGGRAYQGCDNWILSWCECDAEGGHKKIGRWRYTRRIAPIAVVVRAPGSFAPGDKRSDQLAQVLLFLGCHEYEIREKYKIYSNDRSSYTLAGMK